MERPVRRPLPGVVRAASGGGAGALSLGLPDGPVADLACGLFGGDLALLAAAAGRRVSAVDISRWWRSACWPMRLVRRGLLGDMITGGAGRLPWRPNRGGYALVLCTGFGYGAVFATAAGAVAAGGVLGWEAFTAEARQGPGARA